MPKSEVETVYFKLLLFPKFTKWAHLAQGQRGSALSTPYMTHATDKLNIIKKTKTISKNVLKYFSIYICLNQWKE